MKKAIFGTLATLPLVTASVFTNANSAQAITFKGGEILQINADFRNSNANPQALRFFNGATQPRPTLTNLGQYGTFGIGDDSTGGFQAFANNGATNNINYKILSLDFSNPVNYVGKEFLKAEKLGANNAVIDDFKFIITAPITEKTLGGNSSGVFTFSNVQGIFTSTKPFNSVIGNAFLSGTYIRNNGTFSATLEVASVPEPTTLAGLGLVAGALAVSQNRKKNQAK